MHRVVRFLEKKVCMISTLAKLSLFLLIGTQVYAIRPMDENYSPFRSEPTSVRQMSFEEVYGLAREIKAAVLNGTSGTLTHSELENAKMALQSMGRGTFPRRHFWVFEGAVAGYEQVQDFEFKRQIVPLVNIVYQILTSTDSSQIAHLCTELLRTSPPSKD